MKVICVDAPSNRAASNKKLEITSGVWPRIGPTDQSVGEVENCWLSRAVVDNLRSFVRTNHELFETVQHGSLKYCGRVCHASK